jgi:protoheme IX farnesyltransferase
MNDFLELTKPRLSSLVIVTVAVAYFVASPGSFNAASFAAVLLGMALVVGGGNALNQYAEREFDAQMPRTQSRPLPSGRVHPTAALAFGVVCVLVGLALLYVGANPLSAALAAIAAVLYVLVYTPLKRKTPLCTLVGAIPGAIPPMIGWTAARGSIDAGAWALFAIQFLWQMPHFMAISRLYREDYERGGYPMLSVLDPSGVAPGRMSLIFALALVPATMAPYFMGLLGTAYLVISLALGATFLGMVIWSLMGGGRTRQRWVFLSSLLYLMGLLAFMLIDRQPPTL